MDLQDQPLRTSWNVFLLVALRLHRAPARVWKKTYTSSEASITITSENKLSGVRWHHKIRPGTYWLKGMRYATVASLKKSMSWFKRIKSCLVETWTAKSQGWSRLLCFKRVERRNYDTSEKPCWFLSVAQSSQCFLCRRKIPLALHWRVPQTRLAHPPNRFAWLKEIALPIFSTENTLKNNS